MGKGKSTCAAWVCGETKGQSKVIFYNKKNEVKKEKMMFSKWAKKRTLHKLKEVKSSS